jgi:hypothetical protein
MKAHVHAWAGFARPALRQKYVCNNKQQQQNMKSFPETKEMNASVWQGRPPGARGA